MRSPTLAAPTPDLRRARASDGTAVGAFLDSLSTRSRYFRFHGACSGASPALQKLLCDVDGTRHQAWLAWIGEGAAAIVVGEARFVMSSPSRDAELAIVVDDAYQGTGLAQLLMRQLLGAAALAGITRLYGEVMDSNARMKAFLRRHRFDTIQRCAGEVIRMSRDLRLVPEAGAAFGAGATCASNAGASRPASRAGLPCAVAVS